MLRLTTFGGVGIRGEGAGTAGPAVSRRALALLVLVAAARDTGISRDKALAYLWPESDEERGRNALRQSLHTLRRELQAPDLLLGTDTLRLNPAVITSDLRELEAARAAGKPEVAVACYAGPFLDGFHVGGVPEFERWVEETRSGYAREVATLVAGLARAAGRNGDTAGAVGWWRRLAALEPLNSAVALGLMEALAAAGDRVGALRHGQVHETLVREEFGAAPDPAVRALSDRLRSGGEPSAPPPPAPVPERRAPRRAEFLPRLRAALDGRYAIGAEMERGRDGAIRLLRARDLRHEREVLLKVVHPALANVLDLNRFLREIKLTARLGHPHILPLLDSGEVDGHPWYAMPEIGGVSLRARLSTESRLPTDEAIRVVQEIAGALDHAHRHDVVHRDVSPENIVLAEGNALLTNLGVARALDAAGGPRITETGMLVGSPAYMSPEQASGTAPVDGRSDQFSLACVLYEMLVGEPLFTGPTPQAIMAKRAAYRPERAEQLAQLPEPVAGALVRALAPEPGGRYGTAGEFAAALLSADPARRPPRSQWLGWLGFGS